MFSIIDIGISAIFLIAPSLKSFSSRRDILVELIKEVMPTFHVL